MDMANKEQHSGNTGKKEAKLSLKEKRKMKKEKQAAKSY
jgi:hypothetical protein